MLWHDAISNEMLMYYLARSSVKSSAYQMSVLLGVSKDGYCSRDFFTVSLFFNVTSGFMLTADWPWTLWFWQLERQADCEQYYNK